ncbi:hypothetical protein EFK50_06475 [Nocardioides marmoriginsengisoli]|uniref:Uncharacterized protein n=1 Tax=Nocardioides marmoriginsengisoli TaxID=661483 RepID=A0A3N0CMP2_9ACTN|nr:hypothetical protein EFK50_06475 [Nocardioides marmoriginsengisoli]
MRPDYESPLVTSAEDYAQTLAVDESELSESTDSPFKITVEHVATVNHCHDTASTNDVTLRRKICPEASAAQQYRYDDDYAHTACDPTRPAS